jgi:two-component system chemotaxis sensor kinase CheA
LAKDPYKYFRIEARELCEQMASGVLEIESHFDAELIARLLRFAHTLKGAARVVKQLDIAKDAHSIEEVLLAKRAAQSTATPEETQRLLGLLDRVGELVAGLPTMPESEPPLGAASLPPPASEPPKGSTPRQNELASSLRVEIEQMEGLARAAGNASQRMAALRQELGTLSRLTSLSSSISDALAPRAERAGLSGTPLTRLRALSEELNTEVERLQRALGSAVADADAELDTVYEAAHQLRLMPASMLFPVLERAVYDAALELGKRASLEVSGGEVRMEAHVLSALKDSLLHVVRNAVAHGIEAPAQRLAAGKPERGLVRLTVRRKGTRVTIRCQDDGSGIDLAAIRRAGVERGLVRESAAEHLSERELTELLMHSGLSTSRHVSEIAGRGIGLDVVKEAISRLKGAVRVESKQGAGTCIELDVPLSVAAIPALFVQVGSTRAALPLEAVAATVRLPVNEVTRTQNREAIVYDGQVVPFVPAERVLRSRDAKPSDRRAWSVVLLRNGEKRAALGVDRILTSGNVVMRALPKLVLADPVVAGAALDAAGDPEIVLDHEVLIELADRARSAEANAEAKPPLPILVVDDSLTTRMLEQSILESAGYSVDLAVSAEDGLTKARAKRYGLFIVDVEMPGMNGFEFVATTRSDPELRVTPAILVSSRDTDEDKRRAASAGARAYIVKGEFEQGHLLTTIRSLME